jgi:glycosyltransferase involved in cell wall biosynthesis
VTLGINGWRILGQRTGVGRYLLEVIRNWDDELVRGRFDEIVLYTPRPAGDLGLPSTIANRVVGPNARMLVWDNVAFGPRARHDVLFCPSFSRPLVARGRPVVTIHEATYRLHPELLPRRGRLAVPRLYLELYGWSGRHAAAVIASSHSAKDDIVRGYGVPAERIHVCPLAPGAAFREVDDLEAVAGARRRYVGEDVPFFLHVGKLSPVRNVPRVVEALAQAKREHGLPHRLVLVGAGEPGVDIGGLARSLGVGEDCIQPGFVPDDDLVLLYNAATAFVLPYTYQTVSLPPLEAMACGTPVITVGTPGLREITGGAAHYVSAPDVSELTDALAAIADPAYARTLVERGRAYVSGLSWRRTAEETLEVLAAAAA